jgi:hypothetical protein
MSRMIRLPSPSEKYDRDNEAALRRQLELEMSDVAEASGTAGPRGADGTDGTNGSNGSSYFDTASFTTASLADLASETGSFTLARAALLWKCETSASARVRLYGTAAFRDADVSRVLGTDPTGEHGLLLELVTTAPTLVFTLAPPAALVNDDTVQADTLYYSVTNKSGTTQAVVVDLSASILVP